jgi:hypothetical protein
MESNVEELIDFIQERLGTLYQEKEMYLTAVMVSHGFSADSQIARIDAAISAYEQVLGMIKQLGIS